MTPAPATTLTIARRFRGPADSGNGGYVCGRLAAHVLPAPRAVRVRLRVPPPLERALVVEAEEGVALLRGDAPERAIIAEARALAPDTADFRIDLAPPPTFDEAVAAARGFRGRHDHPYPGCFVCGPDRADGDGLRIFPGALPGRPEVASPWIPDASLAAPGDPARVAPEFIWAALDCPGCFAFTLPPDRTFLLGELSVERRSEVAIGERCVALGWELGVDGRKHFVATALFGGDGRCIGVGRATWFEVPATAADAATAPSRKENAS